MADLTEPLRAALERVPDEWGLMPYGAAGFSLRRWEALVERGLAERRIQWRSGWLTTIRRTPAGRAALEVKP